MTWYVSVQNCLIIYTIDILDENLVEVEISFTIAPTVAIHRIVIFIERRNIIIITTTVLLRIGIAHPSNASS